MIEEIILYMFLWLFVSFFIAIVGSDRKIGYWNTFFISLILSPLLGLIVALCSKKEKDVNKNDNITNDKSLQSDFSKPTPKSNNQSISLSSITDGLEKLKKLKDENVITDEEFFMLKNKAINSYNDNSDEISNIKMDDYNPVKIKLRNLYELIQEQENNLFPSIEIKQKIIDLTEELLISKDYAIYAISEYKKIYNTDMIDDLERLTSSYSGKKEYLERFIDLNIVLSEYPHHRIDV